MHEDAEIDKRPRKRTRLIAGCEACRRDTDTPCWNCQQIGIPCNRDIKIRFRHTIAVSEDWEAAFPERKLWLHPQGSLRFCDETSAVAREYDSDSSSFALPSLSSRSIPELDADNDSGLVQQHGVEPEATWGHPTPPRPPLHTSPQQNHYSPFGSPDSHSQSPMVVHNSLDMTSPRVGDLFSTSLSMNPSLSDREAVLMRNFIEKMALWADVTDPKRHFEIEVPRRALYQPVLRYAIFAFSSRHLNRGPRGDETEALHYHSQCLRLLIAALDASEEDEGSDEILASAAILRQFEEMDAEDFQFHLSGTTRMLNSTPEFGFSGGLREATAWLCLRQDIYISLVSQQPLRTNLEKFSHSRVFEDDDDFAWANRIVYLLAKALSCAFRGGPSVATIKILCRLDNEVEDWRMSRPNTFDPIRFVPRSREKERRLPEIWMLFPVHVVGLQYYHIAKILLAVSTQPTLSNAYESLRRGRSIERCVCHHLLVVLGLAQSNAKAENALFTARHCLSAWGGVLRHRLDQAAAEDLLTTVERITGWSTARLIQSLRGQWDEYPDED